LSSKVCQRIVIAGIERCIAWSNGLCKRDRMYPLVRVWSCAEEDAQVRR